MNAEIEQAVGFLEDPLNLQPEPLDFPAPTQRTVEDHWEWRLRMAERLAADMHFDDFGVKGLYIFGSTKNGTAGPASDIDLLVHHDANPEQMQWMHNWFLGWGQSLAEVNFLRTGYRNENILDIHFVNDDDIARRTSYAAKIDAITDAARPLRLRS
jgi:hypothetical protein